MNIVLIGYRGTGKSAVSRALLGILHCRRYSIDEEIIRQAGKSIHEIVEQEGWSKFRAIESKVVEQISSKSRDSIIDCGGGVVLDERNIINLRQNGKVALLTSSLEIIIQRMSLNSDRPLLQGELSFEEEQKKILTEREPKYCAAADCIFETTHTKPYNTAMKIIRRFKKEGWI
jgi:shikimate kinase